MKYYQAPDVYIFDGFPVRALVDSCVVWVYAQDVLKILNISEDKMNKLDDTEKKTISLSRTDKKEVVNLFGIGSLINSSVTNARKSSGFKAWAVESLTPSIMQKYLSDSTGNNETEVRLKMAEMICSCDENRLPYLYGVLTGSKEFIDIDEYRKMQEVKQERRRKDRERKRVERETKRDSKVAEDEET